VGAANKPDQLKNPKKLNRLRTCADDTVEPVRTRGILADRAEVDAHPARQDLHRRMNGWQRAVSVLAAALSLALSLLFACVAIVGTWFVCSLTGSGTPAIGGVILLLLALLLSAHGIGLLTGRSWQAR
jgi:hypothetical protein